MLAFQRIGLCAIIGRQCNVGLHRLLQSPKPNPITYRKASTYPPHLAAELEDLDPDIYGFTRKVETPKSAMHGALKRIQTHLFVSMASSSVQWPKRMEDDDTEDGWASSVVKAVSARKKLMPQTTVTFFTSENKGARTAGHTLLAFPHALRFSGVTASNLSTVLDHLQQPGSPEQIAKDLAVAPIEGHHVFICCHRKRDKRCGFCGPILVEEFRKHLAARALQERVHVYRVSHVGGHEFAGNVLVYSAQKGDWYGYVTPADIPKIIEKDIVGGEWVPELWRGRLGASEEDPKRLAELCKKAS